MGFMKKNKFESDWSLTLLYTPQDLGLAGPDRALDVVGQDIITLCTGTANEAFNAGMEPGDAILVGKAYLISMLSAKYPGRLKEDAIGPSLEEVTRVLTAKYGKRRVQQVMDFTQAFGLFNNLMTTRDEIDAERSSGGTMTTPTPSVDTSQQEPHLLGQAEFDQIKDLLHEIQTTFQLIISFTQSALENRALRAFNPVPRGRRAAELSLFFLWWSEKFVLERLAQEERRELVAESLRALIAEEFGEMDLIGQYRYSEMSALLDEGASSTDLAAVPFRGMNSGINEPDAVSTLAAYQSMLLQKLTAVWSD